MRIQEHIGKITWTLADKFLYLVYGLVVSLVMPHATDKFEYGLFTILITLSTWVFVVGDAFALQSMIQFGVNKDNKRKVNTISLITLTIVGLGGSLLVYLIRYPLSELFHSPGMVQVAAFLPILVILMIPRTFTLKITYRDYAFKKLFFINLAYFGTMTAVTFYLVYSYHHLVLSELLWIYFSGAAVSSLVGIMLTIKDLRFGMVGKIRYKQIFDFSFPLTFQATLHYLPKVTDTFLILYFFDSGVVGTYSIAKNIFRIFDEAASASYGLIYPAAVRQIENKNMSGLNALMTKAISFMLVLFALIVIFFELGVSRYFITTFLPVSYHAAIEQFNVLVLSAIFIPLTLLSLIINAFGNTKIILRYVVVSFIFSLGVFYLIGKMHNPNTIALGLTGYYAMFGSLCYWYSYKYLDFKPMQLFRALGDSMNFLKSFLAKRKGRSYEL